MCFKAPKPPAVPDPDPELIAQKERATAASKRALEEQKNMALYDEISLLENLGGVRSLTGNNGLRGYGSSLLL